MPTAGDSNAGLREVYANQQSLNRDLDGFQYFNNLCIRHGFHSKGIWDHVAFAARGTNVSIIVG